MDKKQLAMPLRARLHEIIFEADTPGGKLFDVLLILSIVISVDKRMRMGFPQHFKVCILRHNTKQDVLQGELMD